MTGTKTIALRLEAYERLRRARLAPNEPFSDVVLRAQWPDAGLTAGDLLDRLEREPPAFTDEELDLIDAADAADPTPRNKWRVR